MEVLTPPEQRRAERGVTLVETLIALLILSFVAVSTLAMFSQGLRLNASGVDYSAITNIAKDKCEELVTMVYTAAALAPNTTMTESMSQPPVTISWTVAEHNIVAGTTDPDTVFAGNPRVSSIAAGTGNLKVISITVSSTSTFATGERTVTVQGIKVQD